MILLAVLLVCALIPMGLLWAMSPGTTEPFLDPTGKPLAGSISEKIQVTINGLEQGMIIQGKSQKNPVLLFVHGGPGMPQYWLTKTYPTGLEDYFTVSWWDHRGAGLSYHSELSPQSITVEQSVSDMLAVADYLRRRFGQDKIYLMAHSGGTYSAIKAAAQSPERFHAYIGMAQLARQLESEKETYEYMIQQYRAAGDERMAKKLEQSRPSFDSHAALRPYLTSLLRDESMHELGIGTAHDMKSVLRGVVLPVMQFREYTLSEKLNIWRGKALLGASPLREKAFEADLFVEVPRLGIPAYFFSGLFDYTVSRRLSKEYLVHLDAPVKGFYTFPESAHSPVFEEPDKARHIFLEDVVKGSANLADRD